MNKWLKSQLAYIDSLPPEPSEQMFDDLGDMVAEARRRASVLGIPAAVAACDVRDGGLAPSLARSILVECLAACRVPKEMLNVAEAAQFLGYSVSGVRKLVRRNAIQFSQPHKHAPIRFKREWLEAVGCSCPANKPKPKARPNRNTDRPATHGFHPALLSRFP